MLIEVNRVVLVPESFREGECRVHAFCELVLDNAIVVKDVALVERRRDGRLLAQMPAKKRVCHCPKCRKRADAVDRYCRWCAFKFRDGLRPAPAGDPRRTHRDFCHPVDQATRDRITWAVVQAVGEARRGGPSGTGRQRRPDGGLTGATKTPTPPGMSRGAPAHQTTREFAIQIVKGA